MQTIDWVRNPDLAPTGFKDSSAYVSLVTAIFEQARETAETTSSYTRDLLTYLLLRRNPATGADIILDHIQPGSEGVVPEDIELLKSSAYRSIERYINGEPSQPYSVVMLLQKMNKNPIQNWANPEEFTLLTLAMWLFTRELNTVDISTQRSCLRLYFDCRARPSRGREREFMNSDVRYDCWLVGEIERIFCMFDDRSDIDRELSYIGSFASLVRASRMVEAGDPIEGILRDEIAWLQDKTTLN